MASTRADPEAIRRAAALLRGGSLVAFPTETVYGLGGDATNDKAVAGIFAAKGRPHFNPLIIHVLDRESAAALVAFDRRAGQVASAFWPGPLTLVLPRRADCTVSRLASAGLDTLAIRVPAHPVARDLLRAFGRPIAAPSANASGRLSPTEAGHVEHSLGDKVAMILDGGRSAVGLESSVLDLSAAAPALLRPGGVPIEALRQVLGPIATDSADAGEMRSPGMMLSHYAPSRPLRMNVTEPRSGEAWLGFGPNSGAALNLSPSGDVIEAAANLFAMLHALDRPEFAAIAVAPIPSSGLGIAINDRLRRAQLQP
jgi:L-threonylcarbamoyladenylate synthase